MENNTTQNQRMFSNRSLIRLLWPLVIEQALAITVGMADTIMVTSCGEAAVSAVSSVDAINVLLIQIFAALATGGAVVASQALGRQDRPMACGTAKQLLYSSAALSTAVMILILIFNKMLLQLIFGNIEAEVMRNAETYFWLSAVSYPFLAVYNSGAALFRSMGNSRVSMFVSLLINVVNIGGNALLIFVFGMGVAGAATASLLSRAAGAVLITILLCRKSNVIFVNRLFRPEFRWGTVKNILRIGVPAGLENGMFQLGKLLVQSLTATFGTAAMAANAISNSVAGFSNIPGTAIGLALITVVGQCMGAGEPRQAQYYTKKLMLWAFALIGIMCAVIFAGAELFVGWFALSAEATEIAVAVLRVFSIVSVMLWVPSFVLPNTLRAAGDARFTMLISVFSMLVFRVGFSYFLAGAMELGVQGVWYAMEIDWFVRVLFFVPRFCSGKWKNKKVLSE